MFSLNVTTMFEAIATADASSVGLKLDTVGAVVSGAAPVAKL